jgi:hypothetical protein
VKRQKADGRVVSAADKSTQAETGGESIVTRPADRQPTDSVNDRPAGGRYADMQTQQPTHWYDRAGRERRCDFCGRDYLAKRSSSRFCSSYCRHAHWVRS